MRVPCDHVAACRIAYVVRSISMGAIGVGNDRHYSGTEVLQEILHIWQSKEYV